MTSILILVFKLKKAAQIADKVSQEYANDSWQCSWGKEDINYVSDTNIVTFLRNLSTPMRSWAN